MEIPHVNRWTAWSCVLYTFAAIPPSPSLGLFIPFFSLNKGYPGLAAMQAFLLHCLSLQALRRGAVKRRKGLVIKISLDFGAILPEFFAIFPFTSRSIQAGFRDRNQFRRTLHAPRCSLFSALSCARPQAAALRDKGSFF